MQRAVVYKEKHHIIVIFVVLKLKVSKKDEYRWRIDKGLKVLIICLLSLIFLPTILYFSL